MSQGHITVSSARPDEVLPLSTILLNVSGSSTSAELLTESVMHTALPLRRRRSDGISQGVSLAFLQVREEVTRAPLVAAEHGACAAQLLVRVQPVLLLAPTQECLVDEALLDEALDFLGLGRRR